jgi:hypothetical protein
VSPSLRVASFLVVAAGLALFAWRRPRPAASAPLAIGSAAADSETLAALRAAGADLTKATEVNYYLYFPTQAQAERAADSARTPLFTTEVRPGADGKSWLCLATATMVPTEAAIRAATERLHALAISLGGEYDGWEAAVTR